MNINAVRFEVPGMNEDSKTLYEKLYGDAGERFVDILSSSPDEIAVISRLIAYISDMKKGA